jgi:hypothetical protein
MSDPVELLRALPLEVFETPKPGDAWECCPLATASDETLIRSVAASIARPKVKIHSSFLLHAPMELLARSRLLQYLPLPKRAAVRRRIAEIAVRYASEGPEIESRSKEYSTVEHALLELSAALLAGDADAVDTSLQYLLPRVSAERLRASLAQAVLPSLGAAGHTPILLMMLPGAAQRFPGMAALLRSPLRAVALEASLRITWMDTVSQSTAGAAAELFDRLAAVPLRTAASTFFSIASIMLAVQRNGYAARLLTPVTNVKTAPEAMRILLRVAALSMLQDDPAHAPYGWSHCFTIPQAILSLADVALDVTRVVRIAATHALGFRAMLGRTRLQYPYIPECRKVGGLLQRDPTEAAAVAFNAAGDERQLIRAPLIEHAATHADCHLVKYTLACLVAADRDPEESALYLAAAAYLGAWWDRQRYGDDDTRDPFHHCGVTLNSDRPLQQRTS